MGHKDPLFLDPQHLADIRQEFLVQKLAVLLAQAAEDLEIDKGRGGILAAKKHGGVVPDGGHEPALTFARELLPGDHQGLFQLFRLRRGDRHIGIHHDTGHDDVSPFY